MAPDALYLYCIADGGGPLDLGKVGLLEGEVTTVGHKEVSAVVSPVPYKEIESSLANIMAHQKVVEIARSKAAVLPVRFGVIFRSREGVQKLLAESYASYRDKLAKLEGKDEYGVKVIMSKEGMTKLQRALGKESPEIGKLARASARAGKGTAYLLKLKAEEALKAESLRALERFTAEADRVLSKSSVDKKRLASDHEQIVLNAAYLVEREEVEEFRRAAQTATSQLEGAGLELHVSGPWAPYSFC